MSSSSSLPLLQVLESAETDLDIISALQAIAKADDTTYRCEETTRLIASKRRIIENSKDNDRLIVGIGEFFLWFMPQAATPELEEALKFARQFCNNDAIINLFIEVLLPSTRSHQDSIYFICR